MEDPSADLKPYIDEQVVESLVFGCERGGVCKNYKKQSKRQDT
jgi:hypothetical protein